MTRSHPPTLITIAKRTIQREALFGHGDLVLVAVSGGRDSMALLHVLAHLRDAIGHRVAAHGVDHGLRAPQAARELDRAEAFARDLDVPFDRTTVDVPPGGNLQARARTARHAALDNAALRRNASCIAMAHHADDRAETVLLRLLRGTSPRGLAVLPPRGRGTGAVDRVRPFIRAERAAIDLHVDRHAVPFADDPSNENPRFLRVRVRRELMPVLVALSPRIVENLVTLAEESCAEREDPPRDAPALTRSLPRGTRAALREIELKSNPEGPGGASKGRIHLPGGLVVRGDKTQVQVVAEGTVWARRRR